MIRKGLVWGTASTLIAVFVYWGTSFGSKGLWRNSCREIGRHGACRDPVTPRLLYSPCRGEVAGEGRCRRFGKLGVRKHTSPQSHAAGVSSIGGEHLSQDWIQAH